MTIKLWRGDPATGEVTETRLRQAEFWKRKDIKSQAIECGLCYRRCTVEKGQAGWCKARENQAGKMEIPHYGQLGSVRRSRLGPNGGGIYAFDPGALALVIGGTYCTSSCKFCTSAQIVWNPNRLDWLPQAAFGGKSPPNDGRRWTGNDRSWFHARGMIHPTGIMELAQNCRATHLVFGDNEPTLSWEYTYDVCRLAHEHGLKNIVFTNGFSETKPIEKLAPFVDAVDLGVKGSLSPAFYERWMRSPGADAAVWRSMLTWRDAGVHLVVSNLLAPPQLQTDEEFTEASKRLYGFIAEHLGEHTLLNQGQAHFPTGHPLRRELLVPQGEFQRPILEAHYMERTAQAHQMARDAGLVYAHDPHGGFTCHNCGGVLVWFSPDHCKMGSEEACTFYRTYCDGCEWHEQHFTDDGRHCGHCGAAVPVKALTPAELARAYADISELAAMGERQFEAGQRQQG